MIRGFRGGGRVAFLYFFLWGRGLVWGCFVGCFGVWLFFLGFFGVVLLLNSYCARASVPEIYMCAARAGVILVSMKMIRMEVFFIYFSLMYIFLRGSHDTR